MKYEFHYQPLLTNSQTQMFTETIPNSVHNNTKIQRLINKLMLTKESRTYFNLPLLMKISQENISFVCHNNYKKNRIDFNKPLTANNLFMTFIYTMWITILIFYTKSSLCALSCFTSFVKTKANWYSFFCVYPFMVIVNHITLSKQSAMQMKF